MRGTESTAREAVTIRFPADEYEALRVFCALTRRSVNDVVVGSVRDYLSGDGRREQFEVALKQARTDYRVALDKLADH